MEQIGLPPMILVTGKRLDIKRKSMMKYAHFDSGKADPKPIFGWYDTDVAPFNMYRNPPSEHELLEVTEEYWIIHMRDLKRKHWSVINGKLNFSG